MKFLITASALAALSLPTAALADGQTDGTLEADERGITLDTGVVEFNLGGRLHLDAATYDDPATGRTDLSDADVRRARLELGVRIGEVVRLRVDREFAGGSKGWRNVWASVAPTDWVEVKGGNFTVPFAMEDLQSSNSMTFAERSIGSSLAPGFGLGGAVFANGRHWSASAGYFTDALDNDVGRSAERGDGFAGRVTVAPVNRSGKVVHFAIAGERRSFNATETVRYSADAGSQLAPTLMSSGRFGDIDHQWAWTGEAGASFGPFQMLGSLTGLRADRPVAGDVRFSGQTVQASWLVTGGRYLYAEKQGVFGGPDLRKGRPLELAARYSRLDLNNSVVDNGIGRALTGGLNWYPLRNLRLMADYTDSRVRFPDGGATLHNHVGVARVQVNF